jgi:hypothetical protein
LGNARPASLFGSESPGWWRFRVDPAEILDIVCMLASRKGGENMSFLSRRAAAGIAVVSMLVGSPCFAKTIEATGRDCQAGNVKACAELRRIATTAKSPKDRLAAISFISDSSVLSAIANDATQAPRVSLAAGSRLAAVNKQAAERLQPVVPKSLEPQLLWEDVAKSGDLDKYYKFVQLHPDDRVYEIRKLVDAFWRAKIMEGENTGKRVVYNAIEVGGGHGTRGIMTIGSGPIPVYNVGLYSDPTDPLTIGLEADNSFFYLGGRGLGVANDTIYCFGFVKGTKVTNLKELQSLDLSGTAVTVESDFHGRHPLTLQTLDLSGTVVTEADLEYLKDIKGLTALTLWNTGVTDAGLKFLEGLQGLRWLDLSGTAVTDSGLEHLKGLQELRTLHLEKTKVTDAGAAILRKALPGCVIRQTW